MEQWSDFQSSTFDDGSGGNTHPAKKRRIDDVLTVVNPQLEHGLCPLPQSQPADLTMQITPAPFTNLWPSSTLQQQLTVAPQSAVSDSFTPMEHNIHIFTNPGFAFPNQQHWQNIPQAQAGVVFQNDNANEAVFYGQNCSVWNTSADYQQRNINTLLPMPYSNLAVTESKRPFQGTLETPFPSEVSPGVQENNSDAELVCFGMVINLTGISSSMPQGVSRPVRLQACDTFVAVDHPNCRGKIDPDFTFISTALLGESDLELEASVRMLEEKPIAKNKARRILTSSKPCTLSIIIYGPRSLLEEIGSFFQDYEIYLQDPVGCKKNVPYCNPHRMEPHQEVFTFDFAKLTATMLDMVDVEARPELLDILDSQEDHPEAMQPRSVRTNLARHQKQALTFMLQRELGWAWDGYRPDIWEVGYRGDDQCFINRVSDTVQDSPPPQFYGGIIADPMGLGKTLSMIALIASDIDAEGAEGSPYHNGPINDESSGRTLIVVPPPLLGTWEEQLTEHVFPNCLPWYKHHAKSRLADTTQLEQNLIVITTYHTVSAEWKNSNGIETSLLFQTRWKRVILDEAHYIRNSESRMARSICSLHAHTRWAVTGTPIQNRLGDLATLLKFLKVYPYSEKQAFDTDIAYFWKSGSDDEAVKRLKRLCGCLLLRRPKAILDLPLRKDVQCMVELTPGERQLYDGIRSQALVKIDEALRQYGGPGRSHSFVNVLQRIEAMRLVCNLGLHYYARRAIDNPRSDDHGTDRWDFVAQQQFNMRCGMDQVQCFVCDSLVDSVADELGDSTQQKAWSIFSRCWTFTCSSCVKESKGATCEHDPHCSAAPVSTDFDSLDDTLSTVPAGAHAESGHPVPSDVSSNLSSKVSRLLYDLQEQPQDVKCIVFSYWRMTLDLVEAGLRQASISCLRFDGKVPQRDRQGVVDTFQGDPSVKVLLLTLSCGAVGLNLTRASRAYLMEPHWNPTLEDQALARIHRIGQEREVTTVRFVVKNSFEERVIEIQDSKRDLAGILLNPQGESGSRSREKPLEWLRKLI